MIRIEVPGVPMAQGSKRHVGNGIMVESSKGLKPWRDSIIAAVREAAPDSDDWIFPGPVEVQMVFRFPRAKSHYGTGKNADKLKPGAPRVKATKPDLDKIIRAALDAITQAGGIWHDDAQVAELHAVKDYGRPGLSILIVGF